MAAGTNKARTIRGATHIPGRPVASSYTANPNTALASSQQIGSKHVLCTDAAEKVREHEVEWRLSNSQGLKVQ